MSSAALMHQIVFLLGEKEREISRGRRSIARCTGLSEMTVRLEMERLRDEGLLTLNKQGASLTSLGMDRFATLFARVKGVRTISLLTLTQEAVTMAALLTCPAARPPWWYRDLVVKEGGDALILLRCRPEGWTFQHDEERVGERNPGDEQALTDAFPLSRDGDLLVIASAADRCHAGLGLWRVISEILSDTE